MKKLTIVIIIFCIIGAVGAIAYKPIVSGISYREATELYNSKKYDEAYLEFTELGDYKDSALKVTEIQEAILAEQKRELYDKATEMMQNKDYSGAIDTFSEISGYKDSDELVKECKYNISMEKYENKEYQEAHAVFVTILDYKDVDEKNNLCVIEMANSYRNNNQVELALETYSLISDEEVQRTILEDYYKELYEGYLLQENYEDICKFIFNDYIIHRPEYYWEIVEQLKEHKSVIINLADQVFARGDFEFASKIYEMIYTSKEEQSKQAIWCAILCEAEKYEYWGETNHKKIEIDGWEILYDGNVYSYTIEYCDWDKIIIEEITNYFNISLNSFEIYEMVPWEEGNRTENYGKVVETYRSEYGKKVKDKKDSEQAEREKRIRENDRKEKEEANSKPTIGMTASEVKNTSWGEPLRINKTTYEWGVHEQWCYSNYRYVYLENGIVYAVTE